MSTVDDSSLECVVHLSASSVQFHAKPDLNRSGFRVFRALDTVPINMGEAAPKTPYRGTDEFRAKEREKYWNLTPEQRARKQAYDREWRRRKRAQQKAKKAAAGSPTSPLQPVSETTAPMETCQADNAATSQACAADAVTRPRVLRGVVHAQSQNASKGVASRGVGILARRNHSAGQSIFRRRSPSLENVGVLV
jgi:hypothetical protein